MKHIYALLFILSSVGVSVGQPATLTGRMESADGSFVFELYSQGDAPQAGILQVVGDGNPAIRDLEVPAVFVLPAVGESVRPRNYRSDFAGRTTIDLVNLAERDGELVLEMEINMAGDMVNRRVSSLWVPELKNMDGHRLPGPGILVNGRVRGKLFNRHQTQVDTLMPCELPRMNVSVTGIGDSLIRYNLTAPYELWMDDAVLDIHHSIGSPAGKEQLYTLTGVADVKLQPREPYIVQPQVSFVMPEREQKSRRLQGQAFLDFAAGRSVIVPGYRRNPEELAKIDATIRNVQDDPDVEINSLFIEGYASPEGSYASNERLARERSQALADYIAQHYGFSSGMIRVSSVAEDWDGLRLLVEESAIPRRDDILAIIDNDDAPDRKEQRLRALGAPWTTMLNTMFPQLRRVEYQIDFSVKDYTVEESRALVTVNPEMLSQRELFMLAQSYPEGSSQWEQAFETIIRLYPDNETAIVNYSALLLGRGELAGAKRMLDRVADNPEAANNLGVYFMLSGDLDTAETYLRHAQSAGMTEAARNLLELETKREDDKLMERYNR